MLNWKYAIGEVFLIVVGVLIALAASDWQNQRADLRAERAVLREIGAALESDLPALERSLARFERVDTIGEHVLLHIRAHLPYADSLDASLGALYRLNFAFSPNFGPYESLKSQGLRLVSDERLRFQIAQVYEQTYTALLRSDEADRTTVLDVMRPYFLEHFRDLDVGRNATPIDYTALVSDPKFANLISYRINLIQRNHIPILTDGIDKIRALAEAIESEVGPPGG